MEYYAKYDKNKNGKKYETLREHTDKVLVEFNRFKNLYEKEIERLVKNIEIKNKEEIFKIELDTFWEILKDCCEFHDYGKTNIKFQNKLRKLMELELLEEKVDYGEIPHGYLSAAFFPSSKYDKAIRNIAIQSIAYHHERDEEPNNEAIKITFQKDLIPNLDKINLHMNCKLDKINQKYLNSIKTTSRIKDFNANYKLYVMIKGLLHRMDHSASACCRIEEESNYSINEATKMYLSKFGLREVQEFADNNKEKNIVIVASTGIGKTETALLWIGKDKGFFTLPLRVSINALFKRVEDEIGYKSVGLLHSSAIDYLEENGYENYYEIYEYSKLLSKKITFSTIDQIFKFPFKFRGYEKILATLAYSKIIIDEVQAYSPHIVAVIIKGIEILNKLGGRFLIMTATLPKIYKEELEKRGIKFEYKIYPSEMKRHKICIKDEIINSNISEIIEKGKSNKVLVIANTVKKALEIYNDINDVDKSLNMKLLHSMFIGRDRSKLEREIKEFTDKGDEFCGIWITTQIVEASLDVDFDYLFTEMSTLDSQFQRFGRCYRKRPFNLIEPNIYIFTKDISGAGTIYDENILSKSIELLIKWDKMIISEKIKMDLVDKLYSKESLKGTKFYNEFLSTMKLIDNFLDYEISGPEAQKALRDIKSKRVIPIELYNDNIDLFLELCKVKGEDRLKLINKINKLSVNVQDYALKNKETLIDGFRDLYTADYKYDSEMGLLLNESSYMIF